MSDDIKLPPQPDLQVLRTVMPGDHRYGHVHGFTRRDLVRYARAAVLADREGRKDDGSRLDWLESQINKHGAIHLHDGTQPYGMGLGLRPGCATRSLRVAIDQANSHSDAQGTKEPK